MPGTPQATRRARYIFARSRFSPEKVFPGSIAKASHDPNPLLRAALATVVGVLIEVPVMLLVVRVVNESKTWYERSEPASEPRSR